MFEPSTWNLFFFVSNCFLKVKMLDFSTTTYDDLLESSQYKETLEETRRVQNISQSLTNIRRVNGKCFRLCRYWSNLTNFFL
jgi:hypothetical protein